MKVTDAFLGEHAVFYAQFHACEQILDTADLASLRQHAALLASALHTHAQLEDELLFDDLQRGDGTPTLFAVMEQEHSDIERLLVLIQQERDTDDARDLLREIIHAAREHFEKEERIAFPMAAQILGDAALVQLGERWAAARGVALIDEVPVL